MLRGAMHTGAVTGARQRRRLSRQERLSGKRVEEAFRKRAEMTPRAARAKLDEAAAEVWALGVRMMEAGGTGGAIYANPVPVRPKSGKPMWNRRGDDGGLKSEEQAPEKVDEDTRKIVNTASHGVVRHRMPESLHEQGKKWRHGDRTCKWRDLAVRAFQKRGGLGRGIQIGIQTVFRDTQVRA